MMKCWINEEKDVVWNDCDDPDDWRYGLPIHFQDGFWSPPVIVFKPVHAISRNSGSNWMVLK